LLGAVGLVGTLLASIVVKPLRKIVPPRREKPLRDTLAFKWSRRIQKQPWFWLVLGTAILGVLSIPIFGLHLGFSDEGNYPEDTTTRQAYDLVAEGFGPGYNGPFILAIETDSPDDVATVQAIAASVANVDGVDRVNPPFPNNVDDPAASGAFLIQIVPDTSPQDRATEDTVRAVRDVVAPMIDGTGIEADLTGAVPANIDFSGYLSGRILVFFGAVLGVSFLLLMMVFPARADAGFRRR
jgi:RND superfamily putative drug exporter